MERVCIIDRREAERLADRILVALSDWYYESGFDSEHYRNPDTGGIYETRLAAMMDVPNVPNGFQEGTIDVPSPLFLAATEILMEGGYVKRLKRKPNYPVLGLQHTEKGLKRAAELKSSWLDKTVSESKDRVFIVHGHDDATKQMIAQFLKEIGLEVVILHEVPNKGRTIIEKFEAHSSVEYAVVLLTPDDVGGLKSEPDKQSQRARQNAIFEMGYFFGSLGRGKTCALLHHGVEQPSDLHGILYIPLDQEGEWKLRLAKELKAAGLNVNWDRAIE
jgi:predicted nucleotide-binding protein